METEKHQDDPAFVIKTWVNEHSDKLYSWCLYKINNKEIAEDLVQDTFIAAFQVLHKFEGKSNPKTWLFSILNNKIADHFRRLYRNPTITESEINSPSESSFFETFFSEDGSWLKEERPGQWEDDSNLLDNREFVITLRACMGKLPSNWFAAINLKYLEEKKGDQICQELQITPTNFWQILHRSKLQLRKCLEIHWFKK